MMQEREITERRDGVKEGGEGRGQGDRRKGEEREAWIHFQGKTRWE